MLRNARSTLASIALGAATAASGQCVVSFTALDILDVSATDAQIVDLDGDSHPDLVIADSITTKSIYTMLNNGDGTLRAPQAVVSAARNVAIGDLDGDGAPDLVGAVRSPSMIDVLLGDGGGGFIPFGSYSAGSICNDVALGDLNGDGRLDVVAVNAGGNSVTVRLGNGDGTFLGATSLAVGGEPLELLVEDLDLDGLLDICTTDFIDGTLTILWGLGGGEFAKAEKIAVGSNASSVEVGDVNRDGLPDLVAAVGFPTGIAVALNQGGRSFAPVAHFASTAVPDRVRIADLNGDGHADVAAGLSAGDAVEVMLGDGAGGFVHGALLPLDGPIGLTLGDLDGDDRIDMACSSFAERWAVVWMNTSSSYLPPTVVSQPKSAVLPPGATAIFAVTANSGSGLPLSYRWRRNGVPLADDGRITGAETPELRLTAVNPGDAAAYEVEISIPACDGGDVATLSVPAALAVEGSACPGDFNADGALDTRDVISFLNAWTGGC